MLKIYTDAAGYPNSNFFGIGILIVENKVQHQLHFKVNATDIHQAEFLAAIKGLKYSIETLHNTDLIFLYSDSKILVDSISKEYSKSYQRDLNIFLSLSKKINILLPTWISDKENSGAHHLALQGLHSN